MASFRTLDDLDVAGKRVLVRLDLNVPMKNGVVTDGTRIDRQAPTVRELAEKGARVIVLSHFERPGGKVVPELSLQPVAPALSKAIGRPVAFASDCIGQDAENAVRKLCNGEVLLLENTRFHSGEEKNDAGFAKELAALGEIYVNDAFSAAHRAHASTEGVARLLPNAAGRSMQGELSHLQRAIEKPERPLMAMVGGAKISSKIAILENLAARVDILVIGGAMANTFLAAQGFSIGCSLTENNQIDVAKRVIASAESRGMTLLLPGDVVVAHELKPDGANRIVGASQVAEDEMILDVGPRTIQAFGRALNGAKTLLWNGPLGAFETPPFDRGTNAAARAVAERTREGKLLSVAGGGDTVAALAHAGVETDFSYVSTAGGAFLEWLEGRTLPGVAILDHR
ncbi:MAG TPA: phosphoglycerate kinase [Micropepsaceae bacterium]|nr:phosphoglycerate kinase [Micropepsaceae bacterium]